MVPGSPASAIARPSGRTPAVTAPSCPGAPRSRVTGTTVPSTSTPSVTLRPGSRFIAGDPMKPATNSCRAGRRAPAGATCCSTPRQNRDPVAHASWPRPGRGSHRPWSRPARRCSARSRCGSGPGASRRGWKRLVHAERPAARARSPGPSPPAAAGRRRGRGAVRCRSSSRISGRLRDPPPDLGLATLRYSRLKPMFSQRSGAGRARSSGTPSRCPAPRRQVVDVAIADEDAAAVHSLQPGHHPQRCGLAAPDGPTSTSSSPSPISSDSRSTAGRCAGHA